MSVFNAGDDLDFGLVAPIGPERTVEQLIAREIRESILDGRLKPGVRLPYRQLASQFTVSVTPVRVALRELLTEGLVELRPHGGASVTRLSLEELEELYLMRTAIESWLARLGAPELTDDDIELMRSRLAELEQATQSRDRARYLRSGGDYRWICYGAAGRPRLFATASQLFHRSSRYNFLSLDEDSRLDRSFELAREFGRCCFERDGEGAGRAIRDTLEWSLECVSISLRESIDHQ